MAPKYAPWKEHREDEEKSKMMKRTPLIYPAALLIAGVALGCDDDDGDAGSENTAKLCSDGKDNDGDGDADCKDNDCADFPVCLDTVEPESTFHVFLLLGQSNMVGYPEPEEEDLEEDERIEVLGYDSCPATGRVTNEWDVAVPPLHNCSEGLGPGDYFAKTFIDVLPEGHTIGLVPCAINGQEIETFMKEVDRKYDWIIDRAKIAQDAGGVIDGILFHQGESNNGDPAWPGNVNTLVEDLKADLGLGDIPFLAGELLYSGSCAGHNRLINQLPDVVTNAHVVSADGLEVDPSDTTWELHFGRDAQVELGKRYAKKMIEVLDL
jgi:hypothetical protein